MGQPSWNRAMLHGDEVVLSHRQREWLVTVPDDVIANVSQQDEDDGSIAVMLIDAEADSIADEVAVPWEGRLDQPTVRLHNAEQDVHDLPSTHERDG